jgi:hypothetical protein
MSLPLARAAAVGLTLLLTGCLPDSVNPLSPADQAVEAPELLGLWRAPADDATLYVHAFLGEDGRLELVTVSHEADGSGDSQWYAGHVTGIQGADGQERRFINLRPAEAAPEASEPYVIVGYDLRGDTLTAKFLSPEILAAAIAAGQLAGEVTEGSFGLDVRLTGPGAEIAEFLGAAGDATLFGQRMEFTRVPLAP